VPRFPKSEPKIAQLAQQIATGLERAAEQFPIPPVPPAALQALLDDYKEKSAELTRARAEAKIKRVDKNDALKALKDGMRADLRYAEIRARRNPEQLIQLGWGARRPRTELKPPGEVRNIKIEGEGDTWLLLTWEAPDDGGEVAWYEIQRREPRGKWEDHATSTDRLELLRDQPRGVDLEFRVLAKNNAGTGGPSATVKAVL
jgi:hypothetical protein